ncbi:hypothetical protein EIL50_01655 [bacterium NHP-B]|nr:hypothetical protein EIL50_01655 [bacterium NHP-B]
MKKRMLRGTAAVLCLFFMHAALMGKGSDGEAGPADGHASGMRARYDGHERYETLDPCEKPASPTFFQRMKPGDTCWLTVRTREEGQPSQEAALCYYMPPTDTAYKGTFFRIFTQQFDPVSPAKKKEHKVPPTLSAASSVDDVYDLLTQRLPTDRKAEKEEYILYWICHEVYLSQRCQAVFPPLRSKRLTCLYFGSGFLSSYHLEGVDAPNLKRCIYAKESPGLTATKKAGHPTKSDADPAGAQHVEETFLPAIAITETVNIFATTSIGMPATHPFPHDRLFPHHGDTLSGVTFWGRFIAIPRHSLDRAEGPCPPTLFCAGNEWGYVDSLPPPKAPTRMPQGRSSKGKRANAPVGGRSDSTALLIPEHEDPLEEDPLPQRFSSPDPDPQSFFSHIALCAGPGPIRDWPVFSADAFVFSVTHPVTDDALAAMDLANGYRALASFLKLSLPETALTDEAIHAQGVPFLKLKNTDITWKELSIVLVNLEGEVLASRDVELTIWRTQKVKGADGVDALHAHIILAAKPGHTPLPLIKAGPIYIKTPEQCTIRFGDKESVIILSRYLEMWWAETRQRIGTSAKSVKSAS